MNRLQVWEILTSDEAPVNLFFAVPTIYAKVTFICSMSVSWSLNVFNVFLQLVEHHRAAEMEEDATVAALTNNLRLCVR